MQALDNDKHVELNRLKELGKNTRKPLKLHLGCGPRVLKGWVNIDLQFEPYEQYLKYYTNKYYGPKIRGSKEEFFAINIVRQPIPLPDNSVDIIFHEDFIEHLNQKEQYLLLAECYRILKKGGVHRINTPDIIQSMKINSNFNKGYDGVYSKEWTDHGHKNVLSWQVLEQMAKLVGYRKCVRLKRDQSYAKIPKEYRPDPNDRAENGNLHVDLIK